MRRFHIAFSVADVAESVRDYTGRLGREPVVVVAGEYALWRTEILNFSIRRTHVQPGALRHVGWEDTDTSGICVQEDVNGLMWEYFNPVAQAEEIRQLWPGANKVTEKKGLGE